MRLRLLCLPASVAAVAACASSKPVTDSAAGVPTASVSTSGSAGPVIWSGSLQPMQQTSGGLGPTGQNKAFGSVRLSSKGTARTAISIQVSTPLSSAASLNWAMLPGRCGTGSLPLVGVERFPVIEVGNNGRGQLEGDMALELPESGTYHVNIYWGSGSQLSDVMTCANLRK
ncbi:MAG TPA: hypothetical protein VFD22_12400 [Gemmatimonadaceae bacterium]|nr:hypothetical protein [Gemmatimonadaceae bacterium]